MVDIHRPELGNARRRKRLVIAGIVIVVIAAATFGVSRMPQAAPEVDSSGLFIDTVKRVGIAPFKQRVYGKREVAHA